MNLRSFDIDKTINWKKIKLTPLYSASEPYKLFKCTNLDNSLPLFKTGEVIVRTTKDSNDSNENHWNMKVQMNNTRDVAGIQKIEGCMISLVEKYSEFLFGVSFNYTESENIFMRSDNVRMLTLFCETDNVLNATPNFSVYEPNKTVISSERIVEDVVCVCAISPWILQVYPKMRRISILWTIYQCMILQEPVSTDCILDADYEDDEEQKQV